MKELLLSLLGIQVMHADSILNSPASMSKWYDMPVAALLMIGIPIVIGYVIYWRRKHGRY